AGPAWASRSASRWGRRTGGPSSWRRRGGPERRSASACQSSRRGLLTASQTRADRERPVALDYHEFSVLVVDDEPDILSSFRYNYGEDFDILTAESGPRGLQLAPEP